jgi:uroporphyrinogen-III synthase
MGRALEGRTVALAEGRQLEELAEMLEKEGATPLRCPMVSILDAPDPAPVVAWLRELIAGQLDYIVLLTGEGVRRLLSFADREGLRKSVIAALGRVRTVTRGPKPVRALKEVGLSPTEVAETPTTEGVIAALRGEPLRGKAVGVQLYAPTNAPLVSFLESEGARVRTVLPYVFAPKADDERVVDLIGRLAAGTVDVFVITSSPQVDRLFEVAGQLGLDGTLRDGLQRTRVAAIGPVVAQSVRQRGLPVAICPEQGFVMKNLVQMIRREFDKVV